MASRREALGSYGNWRGIWALLVSSFRTAQYGTDSGVLSRHAIGLNQFGMYDASLKSWRACAGCSMLLRVYDNSRQADVGAAIQEPVLLLEMVSGRRIYPSALKEVMDTPDWAKPALEAAFELDCG